MCARAVARPRPVEGATCGSSSTAWASRTSARAHRAALIAHFEAHADAARRRRAAPPAQQPAAHPGHQEPGDAGAGRGRAEADGLPGRRRRWRTSTRVRAVLDAVGLRLPHQPAPGARHGLLQPHRVRVGHRPARRAGHGLRRRPLRRPVRAARRQAGAGGRLGPGHRARAAAARAGRRRSRRGARPTPMPWCPTPRRCRGPLPTAEALRAAGVSVLLHAAGKEGRAA